VLLAGRNFGCGSSREMAVWALSQFGIRAIVAPSFGAIFAANCIRNGLVPVVLEEAAVLALAAQASDAASALVLRIDVQASRVEAPDGCHWPFVLTAADRDLLLTGQDAIDRTLSLRAALDAWEAQDRQRRPWVWELPQT
jgi:3-isopropylmalate/(R)-2-methylmalate dehydratase small subunit